ncbi:MAG: TetR/AcrR family transcriptional regulator [Sneathiellales bacterium]|nr:TetR/AcrR family transcriptional regulator [Sneathiellales bacterium]
MTFKKPLLEPRKRPTQSRSEATFDAILEAAARILESEGLNSLNTNLVAEKAGVSIGTLYQYFPTKEVILAELSLRMRRDLLGKISAIIENRKKDTLEEVFNQLIKVAIDRLFDRPRLARVLDYADAFLPLYEEEAEITRQFEKRLTALLTAHNIPNPEIAGRDMNAMARGMIEAAAKAEEMDREALGLRIRHAMNGYLSRPRKG